MKHRLIYIIDSLNMGGAEKLLLQTVIQLNKKHFTPRVCALQERGSDTFKDEIDRHGIALDVLNIPRLCYPSAIPRMVKYLREHQAALVHTQLQYSDIIGTIASRLVKIPSLCTVHTLVKRESSLPMRLKQRLEWYVHSRYCRKVITVSEASRLNYLQFNTSCPSAKVVKLHNGIDLQRFPHIDRNQQLRIKATLGISERRKVLISVAVLRKEKGIQYGLKALTQVIQQIPDVLYLIVGEGAYRSRLEGIVEAMGLQKHVIFTGHRDDIPQLIAVSDIFLLPTLTEALPTVLAEAMASGIPSIATTVGGIPEMISNHHNGILVPPADADRLAAACLEMLLNVEGAGKMGQAGTLVVQEKFNIKLQVERLEEMYRKVIFHSGAQDETLCG